MAKRSKTPTVKQASASGTKAGRTLTKQAQREARAAAMAEERKLKAKVKELRALGIVSNKIDLRSYKPTRYMRTKIRKYEGLLSGKQSLIEITPQEAKILREQYKGVKGINFVNGKVVVSTPKGEAASVKGEYIRKVRRLGEKGAYIEAIRIPVDPRDPSAIKEWISSGGPEKAKYGQEYFAFRYYGQASLRTLPNVQALLEYLERYEQFDDVNNARDDFDFELYRVWPPEAWEEMAREEQKQREAVKKERKKRERKANKTGRSYIEKRSAKRAKKRTEKAKAKPVRKTKRVRKPANTPKTISDYERIIAEATAKRDALRQRETAKKRAQRAKKKG